MQDTPDKPSRRRHAPELKRQVITACRQPGASVAGIALAHGLNANMVHRWLRSSQPSSGAMSMVGTAPASFVELPLPRARGDVALELIRLELRRGGSSVSVQWPASAAAECGMWLREWLR